MKTYDEGYNKGREDGFRKGRDAARRDEEYGKGFKDGVNFSYRKKDKKRFKPARIYDSFESYWM